MEKTDPEPLRISWEFLYNTTRNKLELHLVFSFRGSGADVKELRAILLGILAGPAGGE